MTRGAHERERGTSLTEMLVTMALFSIVMVAILTISIGFTRTNARTMGRQDQVDTARSAVESMSKYLRTAIMPQQLIDGCAQSTCTGDNAFLLGQTTATRFYANVNNTANTVGPSRVSYAVVATGTGVGRLVQTVQVPDNPDAPQTGATYQYCDATAAGATAACKARVRTTVLADSVRTDGAPMFSYYDMQGQPKTPPAGGSLSASDLHLVVSVEISVTVQRQSGVQARPTTYIARVSLPNAQSTVTDQQTQGPTP